MPSCPLISEVSGDCEDVIGGRPPLGRDPVWKNVSIAPPRPTVDNERWEGGIMPGSGKNDLSRDGRRRTPLPPELRRVNVNAAGIDIGAGHHYVAVPEGRDPQGRAVRQFGCRVS